MDHFIFSENVAFFQKKEGDDIDAIITELFKTIGSSAESIYKRVDPTGTSIAGMKYAFIAFIRDKIPTCFEQEYDPGKNWHEKKFAYLLVIEYNGYVAIQKKDIADVKSLRKALMPIDYNILCKVLDDKKMVYKRFGMNNLDISDNAMRSKALEAEDLKPVFSTLGASNYALTNYRITNTQGAFSIGIDNSKINHLQTKVTFTEYLSWCKTIIDKIAKTSAKDVSNYLSIFATPIDYKQEYDAGNLKAKYLLVSVYRLNDEKWIESISEDGTGGEIRVEDICDLFSKSIKLDDDGGGKYSKILAEGKKVEVVVKERGIAFSCDWMKGIHLHGKTDDVILLDYVIENGLFTVMFSSPKLKYTNRKLFKDNKLTGNIDMFLDLFEEDKKLENTKGEKDYERNRLKAADTHFPQKSLFAYIEKKYKQADSIIVCDDLGTEWADHIRVSADSVALIAAKHKGRCFSASAFQEVVGQAQKNLGTFFPLSTMWKRKEKKWSEFYQLSGVDTHITRVRTPGKTANEAIDYWKKAERKGNYQRDLYLVIDFLSKLELEDSLLKLKQGRDFAEKKEAVPMLWLISSLWASCQELNIKLHITCRP